MPTSLSVACSSAITRSSAPYTSPQVEARTAADSAASPVLAALSSSHPCSLEWSACRSFGHARPREHSNTYSV